MPNSNESAALELKTMIFSSRLTSRTVAQHLNVTESWLSRRLSGVVGLQIDDYTLIKLAIENLSRELSHVSTN